MSKFRKFITIFLLVIAIIVAAFEFYRTLSYAVNASMNQLYSGYLWMGVGFVVYIIFHKLIFRKNIDIMQTMSHEGAHMLVGALFLRRKIYEFNAKSAESLSYGDNTLGFVSSSRKGNRISLLSTLAPYMLPYLTFLLLLFRLMIKNQCLPIIDVVIGFSLMFYFFCWKKDTRRDQSDIKLCGVFISYLYIITFLLFNMSLIIYSLSGGITDPINIFGAIKQYFTQTWNDMMMVVDLFKA
ncbi:MAG: hypothetical protein IJZ06_08495 [Bacteroidales bacterium]|nr:hypothetical protein [Bacteroidales bacterium]